MTSRSPLDDVPGTDRIVRTAPIGEDRQLPGAGAQPFSSYMEETKNATLGGPARTPLASPFDIAAGQTTLTPSPTFDTLLGQVGNAQSTFGDLNTYLGNPNLRLKQSSKYLLKNKLTDANTHLRTAATHLGASPPDEEAISPGAGPIQRFIGYVTNGQKLLDESKRRIHEISQSGEAMKPTDFLLVQVQLNLAQQSLEYSSVVLSKAMDDIKTIMSIQL